MRDLARCAQEETTLGDAIRNGHPEPFGVRLGAQDWLKEEAMLWEELIHGIKKQITRQG